MRALHMRLSIRLGRQEKCCGSAADGQRITSKTAPERDRKAAPMVKHYLYCSAGNTEGLDEYVGFFEIGDDGYCCRYLEIRSAGDALRYTEQQPADRFGVLPEGPWDA